MPEISVIMPVYNTEVHLNQSIQSVLEQTFSDFELILVNDGSTDNSLDLCEESAKTDHRIRVINKENEGPSATRNRGIKEAAGNYLCFIDSDDEYKNNYLEKLYSLMEKYDFASCGIQSINDQGRSTLSKEVICNNKNELNANLLEIIEFSILNSPVNKMYKTDLLKKNKILLDEMMDIGEDYHFNLQVLKRCNSFISIPDKLYLYHVRGGSITTIYKCNVIEKRKKNIELTKEVLNQAAIKTDLISKMKLKLIYVYLMQLSLSHELIKKDEIKKNIFDIYFKDIKIESGLSYQIMDLVYKSKCLWAILGLAKIMNWLRKKKGAVLKGGSM